MHTTTEIPATPVVETDQALQATQESLDKVRDILFGTQLREQDHRFVQLEERVAAQLTVFKEETRRQFESLQDLVKSELSALSARVVAETQQRNDAAAGLTDELRGADRSLAEKLESALRSLTESQSASAQQLTQELNNRTGAIDSRIGAAEQHHAAEASNLRTQLFDTTNKLRDESRQWQGELQSTVEKLVAELRSAKTDRSALAGLFTEMAGRLQA